MAIDVNIPSQVKNYANLAAFPATGSLKTIFIAEDTNKTYRWTGSAYVEISATAASTWGAIGGTLSNQTDLQTALNAKVTGNTAITGATKTKITYDSKGLVTSGTDATTADIADSTNKRYVTDANLTTLSNTSGVNTGDQTLSGLGGVPTSRTLTINGTTQDLSADRTFTISTGITIGTTAITSGTVGRVLFEGTGNVVQESANLFWDNTNGRLGIGTSSPSAIIHSVGSVTAASAIARGGLITTTLTAAANNDVLVGLDINPTFTNGAFTGVTNFGLRSSINYAGEYNGILIRNTNSTAGVGVSRFALGNDTNTLLCGLNAFSSVYGSYLNNSSVLCTFPTSDLILATNFNLANSGTSSIRFFTGGYASGQQRMQIFSTGNVAINTTTDAGYKLDVNGTARVTQMTFPATTDKKIFLYEGITDYAIGLAAGAIRLGTPAGNRVAMGNYTGSTFTEICNVSPTGLNLLSGRVDLGADTSNVKLAIYTNTGVSMGLGVSASTFRFSAGGTTNNFVFFDDAAGNKLYSLISLTGAGYYGSGTINASAQLQVDSTTRGFLPPRMTTTQKNAIATPAEGLQVWDTTLKLMFVYNGTTWISL